MKNKKSPTTIPATTKAMQAALLQWYQHNARALPWRERDSGSGGGSHPDPYRVWLSEIMLQQTTVKAVIPYYEKFLRLWPRLENLASASQDDVLKAWAGLGYYARGRNLLKCAESVVRDYGGQFPDTVEGLKRLPGIGEYTAGAIAAIAFNRDVAALDANAERVLARLFAVTAPLPAAKPELRCLGAQFAKGNPDPAAFVQALMDLGAGICTVRAPLCGQCPLQGYCAAKKQGIQETIPKKLAKKPRPLRYGTVFWLEKAQENGKAEVFLHKRPDRGLLGGMMALPSSEWVEVSSKAGMKPRASDFFSEKDGVSILARYPGAVRHVFTHFELHLDIVVGKVGKGAVATAPRKLLAEGEPGIWINRKDVADMALPSLMRKVVRFVLKDGKM